MKNRRGATLTELLVAMVVMGAIGAAMMRLMTSQSRFISDQEGQANARRVSQASLNLMLADLRMAEGDSGIVAVSPTSLTLNLPYRMGVSCDTNAGLGHTWVAQQPIDSMVYADAGFHGFGWVDATGAPHYQAGGTRTVVAGSLTCTPNGVDTIPGGRVIRVSPALLGATPGVPVFQYERVTYSFGSSLIYPGRTALFRTVGSSGVPQEIAAPLASTAQFLYYVPGSATPVANPAAGTSILGIDLGMIGLNQRNVTGGKTQTSTFETAIYFKNR